MAETTTTWVFILMTVSAVCIISLACVIYKCRTPPPKRHSPNQYGVSDEDTTHNSNYADNTLSDEADILLMAPLDREDTISSLKNQLVDDVQSVSLANVRYIHIATVKQSFRIKDGVQPREFIENELITFRDIAIGFVDGIPDKYVVENEMTKRAFVIYSICEKQLLSENISQISQIIEIIIYLCKIIVRLRYNKKNKKSKNNNIINVEMRDQNNDKQFKSDLSPIAEWIWHNKMNQIEQDIKLFSINCAKWITEIENSNHNDYGVGNDNDLHPQDL